MAGKIVLDTNVVIRLINDDRGIADSIRGYQHIYIPSVVLGELYFGAFRSAKVEANLDRINLFIRDSDLLALDRTTAYFYGRLKQQLFSMGRPIPENDLWIAAIAVQHQADIATLDRHFDSVDGLTVVGPPS